MSLIILLAVIGFIVYFAIQAAIAVFLGAVAIFGMLILAPIAIGTSGNTGAAFMGLMAMGLLIWFLVSMVSTPKYSSNGRRSDNPFD